MQRKASIVSGVQLATEVTALTLSPPTIAVVPSGWNGGLVAGTAAAQPTTPDPSIAGSATGKQIPGKAYPTVGTGGSVPELDVAVWANGTRALTALTANGGEQHPLDTFADITVTPTPAVKASLDLSTKTTHCNAVIEAKVAGKAGDAITIAFVADGTGVGLLDESTFPALKFHYQSTVTTDANFEAAVTASANLDVKTPGTGANVFADPADTFTATALAGGDDSKMAATSHGLLTGDGPVRVTTTVTIPAGLLAGTDYYVIADDANDFSLAATLADALAGNIIQFTGAGSGTVKTTATGGSVPLQRVFWTALALLGPANDGAASLTSSTAVRNTIPHRARTVAYALTATFGGGSGKVSAAMYPVVDR